MKSRPRPCCALFNSRANSLSIYYARTMATASKKWFLSSILHCFLFFLGGGGVGWSEVDGCWFAFALDGVESVSAPSEHCFTGVGTDDCVVEEPMRNTQRNVTQLLAQRDVIEHARKPQVIHTKNLLLLLNSTRHCLWEQGSSMWNLTSKTNFQTSKIDLTMFWFCFWS